MDSYKTQQRDEIELLQNIIFDFIKIISEDPFEIEIGTISDQFEKPKMKINLTFSLPQNYPDEPLSFLAKDVFHNIAGRKLLKVTEEANDFIKENSGFPVIFQIYDMFKVQL